MTPSVSPNESFDFSKHRALAVDKYRGLRGLYETFSGVVRDVLRAAIPAVCQIHSIEARAKDPDSFGKKASKPSESTPERPKYPEPLTDIKDLAGIRVIAFFPKTLERVDTVVNSEFDVVEKTDKAEELIAAERFGYQSIHYLVKLKATRTDLPEYAKFKDLIAEIQVRTILQHAWAEMEHDIQYKSVAAMPPPIRRRFMSLAGILEIADREFQTIQDEDERVRSQVRDDNELARVVSRQPAADLTGERLINSSQASSSYLPGSARALLDRGAYQDAVRAYDEVIGRYPTVHTNYIGRARAKFLAGDREGALSDLSTAHTLHSADPTIERLRQQIGGGQAVTQSSFATPGHDEVVDGNRRLASGDARGALEMYEKAQDLGWLSIYSKFNCAMARCLAGESATALALLEEFSAEPGTFMEVNVMGLQLICASQTNRECGPTQLDGLRQLGGMPGYSYFKSPLRHLENGFTCHGGTDLYAPVLRILQGVG